MNPPLTKRPHIVFLFSDTGGGHRSASEAIIEALEMDYGSHITTQMVDVLKQVAPQPLDRLPDWYPFMTRVPRHLGSGLPIDRWTPPHGNAYPFCLALCASGAA